MKLVVITGEELNQLIRDAVTDAIEGIPPKLSETPKERLLSRKEAAEKLSISLVTLNDWSKRGLLKSYMIGGRVLYKETEILSSLHQVKTVNF